ncbi:DEAD/DEAH box helicase [Treponema sp.]|uniref:DEAD/DEAH box helicase n=1 Tax=Treponema sp. TaxID=166 RepID=UPI003F0A3161
MKFTEFSLHESLLQGIEGAGYVDCTPVQEQVLKSSLEGRDLYVQSQTGTGKTAAYLTSVIQELLTRGEAAGKKALIMVPTRELAVQVQEEAQKLAKFTSLKCASFYGGVGYDKQVASLKKGVDIMIGTPGRVIDLNHGNQMDLSSVAFLVIDEADRMFDMGFYPDLRTLIKVLPSSEQRQTMLFSATLNSYVKNLAWEYTRNPAEITIAAENITVDEIAQELFHVSSDDKMKLLLGIISREKPESLIVFCNTKKSCEIVAKRLRMNGFESEFIIGDLPQKKRLAIMDKFKAGAIKCLVATDVAARGIDVNDLAMVINYDLPNEAENYVHRIGRTARAGKSGKAFTFCSEQDVYSLPPIERYIEKNIPSCVADESMFAEDKSAGVYIKLDSYHEDYNDKSEFGRRRAAEYNRKNGSSGRSRSSKKGSGRYSSRNEEAKKEYKRDRRVYIDEDKLAKMSTEERMKIYKEKYASFASGSSSNKQKVSAKKQNGAKKNPSTQKNSSGKKNYSSKPVESKKSPQKKSVFARIKSFFGKK